MEPFTYASLAQIRVLLLPIGNIPRSTFEIWAQDIRSIDNVQLGDITTDVKDERSRFMPNHQLASGYLHLTYPSHPPPESHTPLSLFRTSDFPLVVIGIASCGDNDSLATILTQFQTSLHEVFPHESMFPLASNCFVFEESDSTTNINLGDSFPGLVVIPNVMGHKKTYVGTLIADLCSKVLVELATVMQTLESPLGNEYLNATLFPMLPPASELPRSLDDEPRRDSMPLLPSHNSQPELTSPALRSKSPLGLKRHSTMGPSLLPSRHASLPMSPALPKKRPTTIGAASSHGRLFKVLADFFLLAGRLEEATIWYTEAIVLFKNPHDAPWHASALEGLATIPVVEAWASTHGVNGTAGDKDPWADLADKLTQATALYQKANPTTEPEASLSLLSYLYCSSVFRHSTLLYSAWSSKGWGPLAFTTMIQPGPSPFLPATLSNNASPTSASSARNTFAALERLTSITGISRAQIAASLTQAHGPWLLHLDVRERVRALQYIAAMFGSLGFVRKEAYVLREVLGCIMDLVVCGRDERSAGSARVLSAGLTARNSLTGTAAQGTVGIRENERTEGNDSILRLVKHVCRVHGVDLEAVKLLDVNTPNRDSQQSQASEEAEVDEELLRLTQEPFGWPELQIGIIREAIAVAEALPDYPAVAQFSLSSLKLLHPVMSPGDQHHLYSTASRALLTAKRRGERRAVDYWSGKPVVSIEILPLPLVRLPIEKPLSILSQSVAGTTAILTGVKDPFLYNPRKLMSGQAKTVLVQNEPFELVVTLQNPYVFDLDLQSLQLSTSGVPFVSKASPVVVPANSFHPVTISGRALEPGTLIVRGCIVQAPGGVSHEFVLPLSTDEEEERRSGRRSAIECEAGRSKHAGLDSRPWERLSKRASTQPGATTTSTTTKKAIRYLECKVVPEQPLLRIRRTSLTHGAVMLYNGEMSTIRITLENVSSLSVDLIRLTFDDSTIAPAQQALADGDLSVFDTYETEYDLVHRPVFTWDSEHEPHEIRPGQKRVITVNCFGKVGCTSGAIHAAYAYVHRSSEGLQEPPEVFYTRQLSYPVLVTVYHMLECQAMDILSYTGTTTTTSSDDDADEVTLEAKTRTSLLHVGEIADWCIFSIEVRNTYGLPFEVTFERIQEGVEHASVTSLVPPGSTSRIVLPVKKISLTEEHVSRPIPMLSDRQYVVTASNLTAAQERAQRELFWYREELFKGVRGRWRETGGTRAGDLSLRQQRMTLPMLESLRVETARVRMTLVRYDEEGNAQNVPVDPAGSKYLPQPNEFVYLITSITNLSPSELVLTLNITLEPFEHVVYQGELQDIPIGRLGKGESYEVETPVAFVACGRFDFSAEVRALERPRGSNFVGYGKMCIAVGEP